MNVELLIESIVRQTTILIAQLATTGGVRAPLADIANQVFLDLVRELEAQGVSRKVAADMFGMALRTYRRKIQRLGESSTVYGRSLWEAIYDVVSERGMLTRDEVLERFHRDDPALVRSVLQDLADSGLVFKSGVGGRTRYRAATQEELGAVRGEEKEGVDALVWAVVYREGPIERSALGKRLSLDPAELDASVARLVEAARIRSERVGSSTAFRAASFVVTLGSEIGWEASVFDHFQAVVTTVCKKLEANATSALAADRVGGSTYTMEIWSGHPMEAEVLGQLARFRAVVGDLRKRVASHNTSTRLPRRRQKVVLYGGQYVLDHEGEGYDE